MIDRIEWTCSICDKPIKDGKGVIDVDTRQAAICEQAWAELHESKSEGGGLAVYSMSDIRSMPKKAQWFAAHFKCSPNEAGYSFGVARLRTVAAALDWTLHLSEKGWVEYTNWNSFIRKATGISGRY